MTKTKQIALLFFALLFPLVINAQTTKTTRGKFIQVKQIYIEDDNSDTSKEKSITPFLQTEIAKQGFIVVDNKANADAILSGEVSVQITLDGDSRNPPDKAIYRYKLFLSNGELLWKTTVRFVSKSGWTENNKLGAQKIAEKLLTDWQKEIKRADK